MLESETPEDEIEKMMKIVQDAQNPPLNEELLPSPLDFESQEEWYQKKMAELDESIKKLLKKMLSPTRSIFLAYLELNKKSEDKSTPDERIHLAAEWSILSESIASLKEKENDVQFKLFDDAAKLDRQSKRLREAKLKGTLKITNDLAYPINGN